MLRMHNFIKTVFTVVYILFVIISTNQLHFDSIGRLFIHLLISMGGYWALFTLIDVGYFRKKITNFLIEECNPDAYLSEYDKYYGLSSDSKLTPYHALNKSAGFLSQGNLNRTVDSLNHIEPSNLKGQLGFLIPYYINSCCVALEQNNLKIAECYLGLAEELAAKLKGKTLRVLNESIRACRAEILRINGELSESKKIFTELLQSKPVKLNRLSCLYNLGLIEFELNNRDIAKQYFDEVIRDGNKLYTVSLAKQKLLELTEFRDDRGVMAENKIVALT